MMAKRFLPLLLLISAACLACGKLAYSYSSTDALKSVSEQYKIPRDDLVFLGIDIVRSVGPCYEIGDVDGKYTWLVDADYGVIRFFRDNLSYEEDEAYINHNMLQSDQDMRHQKIDPNILEETARNYIISMKPEYAQEPGSYTYFRKMYLRTLGEKYYSYLDRASALVGEYNGKVIIYRNSGNIPLQISTTPAISVQQGADIAVQYVLQKDGVEAAICIEHMDSWLIEDILRNQSIWHHYWVFDYDKPVESAGELLAIYNSLNWNAGTAIAVNGNTGEIIDFGGLLGGSPTKPDVKLAKGSFTNKKGNAHEPPKFIVRPDEVKATLNGRHAELPSSYWVDGIPYVYVKYVPALSGGPAVAVWQNGQAWVKAAGRLAKIRAGSRIADLDGKPVDLGGAPINFRGRIYLPLSAFQALAGVDVRYDSKTKTLSIQSEYLPRVEEKPEEKN